MPVTFNTEYRYAKNQVRHQIYEHKIGMEFELTLGDICYDDGESVSHNHYDFITFE